MGRLGPCGWRASGQEGGEVHIVFVFFCDWQHRFTLLSGRCVLSSCFWVLTLTLNGLVANDTMIIIVLPSLYSRLFSRYLAEIPRIY